MLIRECPDHGSAYVSANMERVAEGNLEYASEKLNVPAAKAEVTAAKVFNDPNLSVSYFNNENNSLQMGEGVEVELSKTFSFGKRGANISLARSESELTEALLADYFRNLRADATIAYMEALKQHELYKVRRMPMRISGHWRRATVSVSHWGKSVRWMLRRAG